MSVTVCVCVRVRACVRACVCVCPLSLPPVCPPSLPPSLLFLLFLFPLLSQQSQPTTHRSCPGPWTCCVNVSMSTDCPSLGTWNLHSCPCSPCLTASVQQPERSHRSWLRSCWRNTMYRQLLTQRTGNFGSGEQWSEL